MKRLLIAAVLLARALPAHAQERCFGGSVEDPGGCRFEAPRWAGEVASLGVNALLGGITGGVVQHLRGGSFRDGFTRGALGGAIVYAGKRVASERFDGAGAIGRTVAAVGSSVVRNASRAVPTFSHLTLPLGPLWLEVRPQTHAVGFRIDPVALAWTLTGIAESELEFDWGETLSAGTLVFRTDGKMLDVGDDSVHAAGVTSAGIIFIADIPAYGPRYFERYLTHERVHVLQEDQLAIQWTDQAAEWLAGELPALRPVTSRVATNLSTEILRLLASFIDRHGDRPWELESIFFAR